jgi:hypothetical protein
MAALAGCSGFRVHGKLPPGDRVVGDARIGIATTHSQDAGQYADPCIVPIPPWIPPALGLHRRDRQRLRMCLRVLKCQRDDTVWRLPPACWRAKRVMGHRGHQPAVRSSAAANTEASTVAQGVRGAERREGAAAAAANRPPNTGRMKFPTRTPSWNLFRNLAREKLSWNCQPTPTPRGGASSDDSWHPTQ